MTIDISELLANIRSWEAADKAYKQAHDAYLLSEEVEPKDHDAAQCAWDKRQSTWHERNDAAMIMYCSRHEDDTLAAFVALADHCEQLQARIDATENDLLSTMNCLRNIADNAPMTEPESNISQGRGYVGTHGFYFAGTLARNLVSRIAAKRGSENK